MSVCLLLLLFSSHALSNEDTDFRIFFQLAQALDFFSNESNPLAAKIVHSFDRDCRILEEWSLPRLRKPFIVIEGNHRKSRNVVGMRLAKMMNGRYLVHPARCLQQFADDLPKGTLFRRAFYILSMYALSFEAKFQLSLNRAVVVNGYWWDMLTYALVQAFPPNRTPDTKEDMFRFPQDLFPPDLVFFLHFPDNLFYRQVTTRNPQTWKPRVLQLYRELHAQGEPLLINQLTGVFRPTTDAIYETILANLSSHRDVWFQTKPKVEFDYQK